MPLLADAALAQQAHAAVLPFGVLGQGEQRQAEARGEQHRQAALVEVAELAADQQQIRTALLLDQPGDLRRAQPCVPGPARLQVEQAQAVGLEGGDAAQQVVVVAAAEHQHLDAAVLAGIAQLERQLQGALVERAELAARLAALLDQPGGVDADVVQRVTVVGHAGQQYQDVHRLSSLSSGTRWRRPGGRRSPPCPAPSRSCRRRRAARRPSRRRPAGRRWARRTRRARASARRP
ncbi:hypothetical protein D3C85_452680 [compost metagenome]